MLNVYNAGKKRSKPSLCVYKYSPMEISKQEKNFHFYITLTYVNVYRCSWIPQEYKPSETGITLEYSGQITIWLPFRVALKVKGKYTVLQIGRERGCNVWVRLRGVSSSGS